MRTLVWQLFGCAACALACGESAKSGSATAGAATAGAATAGAAASTAGAAQGGSSSDGAAGGSASVGGTAGKAAAGSSFGGNGGSAGAAPKSQLSECELSFPYLEQAPRGYWLGADSNFSVVLSPSRAFMTFQDSFVGGASGTSRASTPFVGNSLADIRCEGGEYAIDYHWGGVGSDHRALFDEQKPNERLWIHRPWLYEGALMLTATRVTSDAQGFSELGMTLARVKNPLAPPEAWSIEYFDLTDQRVTVGKGIAETAAHVYLFAPHQADMLLTRIQKPRLLDSVIAESSLEYLKNDGTWGSGLVLEDAKRLGIPANTGLTVRFHDASQRWVALYTNTSGWPSATISVSSAAALEGPWSKPVDVYSVPEMKAGDPSYDPDTICYGASEHPAFNAEPDQKLLFTYTCNSTSFEKQVANLGIYVPRVVVVAAPF
jgi:hypothetical protein